MPDHTAKEQARPQPATKPSTKAPSNSPPMSSFQKPGGISGRK